jgi:ribosomal protein S18 acetylase RimI-like enzyme
MNLNMRWMAEKDIRSVLRIQKSSFNSSKFDKDFISSVVSSRKDPSFGFECFNSFISYVCELNKKVVGYIVYKVSLLEFNKRIHSDYMLDYKKSLPMSGEIVAFCVDEPYRRQGVGSYIINSVVSRFSGVIELSLKDFCPRPFVLYTVCSEKDLGCHLFFKKLEFKGTSVFRNAFGQDHDGYIMVYESFPSKNNITQKCMEAVK